MSPDSILNRSLPYVRALKTVKPLGSSPLVLHSFR